MNKKNTDIKIIPLILNIAVPLIISFLINKMLPDTKELYNSLEKPFFAPPSYIFPIVWTILYILMGIAAYKIYILKYFRILIF